MASPGEKHNPIRVFISYAHQDERFRSRLEKHLSILSRTGIISEWHDRAIKAGEEWAKQIDQNLETSQIILLLISADFIASDYCYDIEMHRAMEKHEAEESRVIPIILKSSDWSGAPFSKLQALPKGAKPITSWKKSDDAWADVARGIREVCQEMQSTSSSSVNTASVQDRNISNSLCAIRFRDYLWPDPVSIKVAMKKLASGDHDIEVLWPPQTQELFDTVAQVLSELEDYHQASSRFHKFSPDAAALALENGEKSHQYADRIRRGVPHRIPKLWKGMSGYWGGIPNRYFENAVKNLLALANLQMQLGLAFYVKRYLPNNTPIPSELTELLDDSSSSSQTFARLFDIDEPVYSAEVFRVSEAHFNHYVFGAESEILRAYFDFSHRPILSSWFVNHLIPQIELILIDCGRVDEEVEYREEAWINKIRDSSGEEVNLDPRLSEMRQTLGFHDSD